MNPIQMNPLSPVHTQSINIPPSENPDSAPMAPVQQVSNASLPTPVSQGVQQIRTLGERASALIKDWCATAKPYLKRTFPNKSAMLWGFLAAYSFASGAGLLGLILSVPYLYSVYKAEKPEAAPQQAAPQESNQVQNNPTSENPKFTQLPVSQHNQTSTLVENSEANAQLQQINDRLEAIEKSQKINDKLLELLKQATDQKQKS